jgi:AraC-like DNA-binding protein
MLLAGDRMANTRDSISEIAQSFGYESASTFTKAFKKIMGCSPRQYSRRSPLWSQWRSALLIVKPETVISSDQKSDPS